VSQKSPNTFTHIRGCLGVLGGNVDIFVGGREGVGAGAAGRCGVGVWCVVGGCAVALFG
jgi:hypothetical protein